MWKREICFTNLPLVGVFLCRVSHNLSMCNLAIALELALLCVIVQQLLSDDGVVKRTAHQTAFTVACTVIEIIHILEYWQFTPQTSYSRRCSSHPKDFVVPRV